MPEQKDRPKQRLAEIVVQVFESYLLKFSEGMGEEFLRGFAGERIPKGTASKREERNRHIREQAAAGKDVATLALAFRLSPAQIKSIIRQK